MFFLLNVLKVSCSPLPEENLVKIGTGPFPLYLTPPVLSTPANPFPVRMIYFCYLYIDLVDSNSYSPLFTMKEDVNALLNPGEYVFFGTPCSYRTRFWMYTESATPGNAPFPYNFNETRTLRLIVYNGSEMSPQFPIYANLGLSSFATGALATTGATFDDETYDSITGSVMLTYYNNMFSFSADQLSISGQTTPVYMKLSFRFYSAAKPITAQQNYNTQNIVMDQLTPEFTLFTMSMDTVPLVVTPATSIILGLSVKTEQMFSGIYYFNVSTVLSSSFVTAAAGTINLTLSFDV